jgi:hypothetical protein
MAHKRKTNSFTHKLQLIQELQENYLPWGYNFAVDILSRTDKDNGYLSKVCFSNKATFHISSKVNHHNCHTWGSQNPHVWGHESYTPKLNVWCRLTSAGMIGPFFFLEKSDRCYVP